MKKVGIVSCYFQKNYGSALQAYATQKILDDLGIENETINYSGLKKSIKRKKIAYYFRESLKLDVLLGKIGYIRLKIKKMNKFTELSSLLKSRDEAFNDFEKNFRISKRINNFEELTVYSKQFDSIMVGSDQLWLPSNLEADYYTLNWVHSGVKRISYSTSFGINKLPKSYNEFARNFLEKFDYLSVRERTGREIVEEVTGMVPEIVCDPTLLFDKTDWNCIHPDQPLIKEKYIFCYFLGDNPEQRDFVNRLKEKTGLKIVAIKFLNVYSNNDKNFGDILPYHAGPAEFINYISNAEYVCTDSFHCTVFSIIYEKSFFVFKRFKENYSLATNSRIDNILDYLGLKARLLSGYEDIDEVASDFLDYHDINKKVTAIREKGRDFIKYALDLGDLYEKN